MQGALSQLAGLRWELFVAGLASGLVAAVLVRLVRPTGPASVVGPLWAAVGVCVAAQQYTPTTAVVAVVAAVAGAALDRVGRLAGPSWWAVGSLLGLAWFATVPDTEGVLAVLGAVTALGAVLLVAPPPPPAVTSVAPVLAVLAVAAVDGTAGRAMAVWGAVAATGGLFVLLVRRPPIVPAAVLAVQLGAGVIGSRVVGHAADLEARGLLAAAVVGVGGAVVALVLPRRLRTQHPLP